MNTQLIQSGGLQQVYDFPQIVYLDFDGELTAYNGEILTVDEVQVEDSGLTKERIQQITASLNEQFAGQNVLFVSDQSDLSGKTYSTIYIGKTDSFSEYGHFAGLAETVDTGNKIKNDKAFVILDSASDNAQIIETIAHEAGHLLGTLDHGGEGLQRYASSYIVSSGVTSTGVVLEWGDSMSVLDGGVASNTTVNYEGYLHVCSGGTATDTTLNSGWMDISSGGTAKSTTVNSGWMDISSGGTANNTTVNSGGSIFIDSGGTANNTTVNSGGWMDVYDGTALAIKENGGYVYCADGAQVSFVSNSFSNCVLSDWMTLHSGTTANNTTVNSGGSIFVYSGGTANNTTVNSGGSIFIDSGGTANNTTVNSDGELYVSRGVTAKTTIVNSGGYMIVYSGGTATSTTVNDGGMDVYDGGTAKTTIVNSGWMDISSDGTATNTTLNSGRMYVSSGGTATNTTVNDGGWMTVCSRGTAKTTIVNSGWMDVSNDGTATDTTVNSGGMDISSGGTATDTTVNSGGWIGVYRGGSATSTTVNSKGHVNIFGGGSANQTTIHSGGCMYLGSGGTATNIIAESGAGLDIGVTSNTYVQGKYNGSSFEMKDACLSNYTVYNKGCVIVSSDGKVNNIRVSSGGDFHLLSGGTATNLVVDKDAELTLQVAQDTYLQGTLDGSAIKMQDGVLSGFTVNSKSSLSVVSGGKAIGTTVNKGAMFGNKGVASNTIVNSGGTMDVGGGTLSGTLNIASGAQVRVCCSEEDLTFDFTVSEQSKPTTALINNWSLISNASWASYTITVKTNQEEGDYVLAGKASGFANTITVKTVEGAELGKISVGKTLFKNNVLYTLKKNSGNLVLTVEDSGPVPTPTESTTKSIAWTGVEGCSKYIVQYSADNFEHSLNVSTAETGLENCGLPKGKWQWRVRTETSSKWQYGDPISKTYSHTTPEAVSAQENGVSDIFFLSSQGTWEEGYAACNVGSFEWQGTNEKVSLEGKNRFSDTITGNTDLNLLVLTDDKNGDALFVDDIFTEFPDEQQSRFVQIDEIRAGAGDDIVDMTSQRFECDDLTVRGGAGNDTIWANKGDNMLFGDAGNDSIVGASGNDVIAGGSGNDTLHGGGGNDTFTFSSNWGSDTVEQLSDGTVTLWFASGSESKWDEKTLTYTDGKNSVKVTGVSAENVTLKFGDDESEEFDSLTAAGAFLETSSEKIFEEKDKGVIATL